MRTGRVLEIQVKQPAPKSNWVWGAFKMPGTVFHELHALWLSREPRDEYFGTLVNEWLARGGEARGVRARAAPMSMSAHSTAIVKRSACSARAAKPALGEEEHPAFEPEPVLAGALAIPSPS